jgi:hypothetical protein
MTFTAENIFFLGAVLIFASIVISKWGYRFGVPTLLLFLFTGMLFGSDGLDLLLDDTLPDADERSELTPSRQCRLDTVKSQGTRLVQRLYDMHIVLEQLLQSHLPFKVGLTIHLALSMTVSLDDSGQFYHAAFLTNAEVVFPVVDGESHAQRELPINSPVWIPFVQTERYVTYADTLFKQHGRLFYLHCHFA